MTLTRILLAATPVPQARGDGGVGGRRVEGERGEAVANEYEQDEKPEESVRSSTRFEASSLGGF